MSWSFQSVPIDSHLRFFYIWSAESTRLAACAQFQRCLPGPTVYLKVTFLRPVNHQILLQKRNVLNGRGWYNSHLRVYFIVDPSVPCCKRLCLLQSQFLALSTCWSPSRHFTSSRKTANSEHVFRRIASRGKNYLVCSFHLDLSGGLRSTFCW